MSVRNKIHHDVQGLTVGRLRVLMLGLDVNTPVYVGKESGISRVTWVEFVPHNPEVLAAPEPHLLLE